ncbi:MAG: hypothetical protein AVDCRST_MAG93-7127, partial [uncultured Chloroflexia bacterium]
WRIPLMAYPQTVPTVRRFQCRSRLMSCGMMRHTIRPRCRGCLP